MLSGDTFLIRYSQQTLADGSLGEGSGKKIGSEYFPSVDVILSMSLIPERF